MIKVPLELTFRDIDKTEAIESLIQSKVGKLEKICPELVSCRVVVESPHEHQRTGSPYRVRISMAIPSGPELVVKRESTQGHVHEDLPMVIRNAFDVAHRQLKEAVKQQRGEVKTHPEQEVMAFVSRLFPEEGYGFLRTVEGGEVYFHRNSVLHDDFDRLEVGAGVRFVEEEGDKGPQASTVEIVDKPGARAPKG